MQLSEFKSLLKGLIHVGFKLPNGEMVPAHFHVTEIGEITKSYIDCGGTLRAENKISVQLWQANDFDHRLSPSKLLDIIQLSEEKLRIGNHEIEVEYQGLTIEKYHLDFDGEFFELVSTTTDCLAKDKCGIPEQKPKVSLAGLGNNSCAPGSGCC